MNIRAGKLIILNGGLSAGKTSVARQFQKIAAMRAHYLAIRTFLDQGINVVADDLIWSEGWLVDLLETFGGRVDGAHRGGARATQKTQAAASDAATAPAVLKAVS